MIDRYRVQPELHTYSVYDVWTAQTVVIAGLPQDHLSYDDASELAEMLNWRARQGDRDLRQ